VATLPVVIPIIYREDSIFAEPVAGFVQTAKAGSKGKGIRGF
jgi:hypothetical protein